MKFSGLCLFTAVLLCLTSCSSKRGVMEYFMDIDTYPAIALGDYSVKIEPSDELLITVNSQNPEASMQFNLPAVNPALREKSAIQTSPQHHTYTVDPEGNIYFPTIGKIHVQGMTVDQLRKYLSDRIGEYIEDPTVYVQLAQYNVIVTGEVTNPGRLDVTQPRYTILDALAAVGDLTQYGRRDNVLLIREENGELKHVRLNLNSADLLTSPYYYLKQNDYIYVEPNDIRKDNAEYSQFYSYKLSVVSTIVSGSAAIISLIIALTR